LRALGEVLVDVLVGEGLFYWGFRNPSRAPLIRLTALRLWHRPHQFADAAGGPSAPQWPARQDSRRADHDPLKSQDNSSDASDRGNEPDDGAEEVASPEEQRTRAAIVTMVTARH
jgi:hypothetical protein